MDKSKFNNNPREEWEILIRRWVFDEKGREMLIRHFLDGITYEKIAEDFDVSRGTVYNKIKNCFDQLMKHCN